CRQLHQLLQIKCSNGNIILCIDELQFVVGPLRLYLQEIRFWQRTCFHQPCSSLHLHVCCHQSYFCIFKQFMIEQNVHISSDHLQRHIILNIFCSIFTGI